MLTFLCVLIVIRTVFSCSGVIVFHKYVFQEPLHDTYAIGVLYQGLNEGLTDECVKLCRAQDNCTSFVMNYDNFVCKGYRNGFKTNVGLVNSSNSNLFERVCYDDMTYSKFDSKCGSNRLWTLEITVGAALDGFVQSRLDNVTRNECGQACVNSRTFDCRSGTYDETSLTCWLSTESRWTQKQAFRENVNTSYSYLENQCTASGSIPV